MGNPCETSDAKDMAVPLYQRGQEVADTGILIGQDTLDVPGEFGLHLDGGNGTHLIVGTLRPMAKLYLDLGYALTTAVGLRALDHLRRWHRRLGTRLDAAGPRVWTVIGWRLTALQMLFLADGVPEEFSDAISQPGTGRPELFVTAVLPGDHAADLVTRADTAPTAAGPWIAAVFAPDVDTAIDIARHRARWEDGE